MKRSQSLARNAAQVRVRGEVLLTCFDQLVRLSLKGVWVRGEIPDGPVVWAMNHHHWWDAFASGSVLRMKGQRPTVLVSDKNLASFGLLNWIDAVPAAAPERAVVALRAGRPLIIMPEGRMLAAGPLGPLRGGAGRIAAQAQVPLLPVALRVVMRASQHAEAFIDIGEAVSAEALDPVLRRSLAAMDEALADADPQEPLPGYRPVVSGRGSVDGLISVLTPWRR